MRLTDPFPVFLILILLLLWRLRRWYRRRFPHGYRCPRKSPKEDTYEPDEKITLEVEIIVRKKDESEGE